MSRWAVRFQLQKGHEQLDSQVYSSSYEPCSEKEALNLLAKLYVKNKDYYTLDHSWNSLLKTAIERAERAVEGGQNVEASPTRNFHSNEFEYRGATYRVDIAVEAGRGHFNRY